ncbi:transporter substrate-binding domain-containing protein [Desulforhopalus sp. IMCC35007]|uniref:transporter substrate-binding domain-containing protein n=1 Tax=Desulforhopalus sp. IMCC35007 TaxID=2569543 RepID=UPI0010AE882B|nr:transporter substrate-binding domain-containing protein [Desulforhopalus sp. IMCC35007]TKB07261.1 transporter substrate-binding domain-containing protein [Desulforhopalus sp. IMCC35007]
MNRRLHRLKIHLLVEVAMFCFLIPATIYATSLQDIRQNGVLRHLGVPYAHFVRHTNTGVDGLDVEMMQLFAKHLGVRYEYVETSWKDVFGDVTGNLTQVSGDDVMTIGTTRVKGDIVANGLTVLPDRQKRVDYSIPVFPTGVWVMARADSPIKPIAPTGDIGKDIEQVKELLKGHSVLSMKGTCLDPDLYDLNSTGADIHYHTSSQFLGDIAQKVVNGEAEITLLDIPDALIALQKWPEEVKIIGPISARQVMGIAVAKDSPELLNEYNRFFRTCWEDGTYKRLVEKYYPAVFLYFGDFFKNSLGE